MKGESSPGCERDPHGIPTNAMTVLPLSPIPTFAVPLLLILRHHRPLLVTLYGKRPAPVS
jgi:hypothetical protein